VKGDHCDPWESILSRGHTFPHPGLALLGCQSTAYQHLRFQFWVKIIETFVKVW
jgi:hypothetical protein